MVACCPGRRHAWRRWEGDTPADWVEEKDWALRRTYSSYSPARLHHDLRHGVEQTGHALKGDSSLTALAEWVLDNIDHEPESEPEREVLAMATYWWRYGR
jgi:hypothetical protein